MLTFEECFRLTINHPQCLPSRLVQFDDLSGAGRIVHFHWTMNKLEVAHKEIGGYRIRCARIARVDPSDLTKRSVTQLVSYLCMYRGALAAKNRAG